MTKEEILKSLNDRVANGTKITNIEKGANIPKNSLASVLKGTREMPDKWMARIEVYLSEPPINFDELEALLDWRKEVDAFCEKREWKAEHLIAKIEEFEKRLKYYAESKFELEQKLGEMIANSSSLTTKVYLTPEGIKAKYGFEAYELWLKSSEGQNKPDIAPETEKRIQDTPEFKKGQDGAENGPPDEFIQRHLGKIKELRAHYAEKAAENKAEGEQMPEDLTPIQQAVWRNNQKMKNKTAPKTTFGSTKKDKE